MGSRKLRAAPAAVPGPGGLTADQLAELALCMARLPAADRDLVVAAVNHWWSFAPQSCEAPSQRRRERRGRHFARVRDLAQELRQALSVEAPLWGTRGIDWGELDRQLGRVAASADAESERPPPRPRGAPVLDWRDDFFALLAAHWPPGKLTVRRGSPFEETAGLLLEWLGQGLDPDDLHTQIIRSLKRGKRAPFKVELL